MGEEHPVGLGSIGTVCVVAGQLDSDVFFHRHAQLNFDRLDQGRWDRAARVEFTPGSG